MLFDLKASLIKKPVPKRIYLSLGVTLFLMTLLSLSFFIRIQQTRIKQESAPPQVLPANTGGVTFKTYKGLNFPWGINNKGVSTFSDWLSSKYDERVTAKSFEEIKGMGVRTVGIWLWFDRMLVKDANWGTDAYVTKFDPTYKANWESFLRMVKSKDMEVIVTMFPGRNGVERDPYTLEGDIFASGSTSAKWKNYIQAIKDWVSMYGSNTEFGPAIAAWQGIKEASDGSNYPMVHNFLVDFYQTIKSTGPTQPVGIDNSPYVKLPVTDPANQYLFTDAADYYNLHIYRDDGAIPDTSKLDKPFIIGELGADNKCPGGGFPPTDCNGAETNLANPTATRNLDAVRTFYTNGLSAGAKLVSAWSWTSNPTIAQHTTDGTNVFGNAGAWIADWNPNTNNTPTPAASPTPASDIAAPTAAPAPASNQKEEAPINSSWFQPVPLNKIKNLLASFSTPESTSSAASSTDLGKTLTVVGTITAIAILMGIFTFVVVP